MTNQITTFDFRDVELRVLTINDEPWFVAVDVCKVLGLALKNGSVTHHLYKLDAEEKIKVTSPSGGKVRKGSLLVSESGLYKLIMRSDKPQAKAFQDWVTKTVLPSIRKDGMYVAGDCFMKNLRVGYVMRFKADYPLCPALPEKFAHGSSNIDAWGLPDTIARETVTLAFLLSVMGGHLVFPSFAS